MTIPKVACLVPVRNKAYFVEQTVKSVLEQTYEGMDILLSDHGSTDGSLEVLKRMAKTYKGPNKVKVLECPLTQYTGIEGLNEHVDWMLQHTEAELFIVVSADDLCHPERVKKTVEAYEKHKPAFIGTLMQFIKPSGEVEGITAFNPNGSRFVTGKEHIEQLVGGSVSNAWDREFYNKIGGVHGLTIPDMFLPFLATLDRGFYIIDEQLFAYIRHPRPDNAGLGGQLLAAKGNDDETLLVNELVNYQTVSTLYQIGRVAVHVYPEQWANAPESTEALFNNIVTRTNDWTLCRDLLNKRKIQPRVL
jgi:glycosyltransferase involved in cell wall biosynthesis